MKVQITNSISCKSYDDLEFGQPFQWLNSGVGLVCFKISDSEYLMCSPWHPCPKLDTAQYRSKHSVVPLVLDSIDAHADSDDTIEELASDCPWD